MTTSIDFKAWPKIARLNREVVITEKIDGTNAAIIITEDGEVGAQSRNRLITVGDDNYGFASWVDRNKDALVKMLGPGRHFGEWWGAGIQRGYGLTGSDKRFSLFDVHRYKEVDFSPLPNVGLVPVLITRWDRDEDGHFSIGASKLEDVPSAVEKLKEYGSLAEPGYDSPEGVIVYHVAADTLFKVTCEDDDKRKGN